MNILVCDDDRAIVDAIEIYLSQEGYTVLKAYDGLEAIRMLQEHEVHLLLLDIMMPHMDGIRATVKIRQTSGIPIIFLSAKSEDTDKILGLNIGADDYITKPFNPLELTARVKSLLRRYTQLGAISEQRPSIFRIGGLMVQILLLLMKNPGKVFSIAQIYEKIWNEDAIGGDNTVAVHIRHIREKIEINPKDPRYLKVVWGVGYKIDREQERI